MKGSSLHRRASCAQREGERKSRGKGISLTPMTKPTPQQSSQNCQGGEGENRRETQVQTCRQQVAFLRWKGWPSSFQLLTSSCVLSPASGDRELLGRGEGLRGKEEEERGSCAAAWWGGLCHSWSVWSLLCPSRHSFCKGRGSYARKRGRG